MTSRILLIISLVSSLSIISNSGQLYATCGTCGVTAPGDSGGDSVGGGGGMNSAAGAAAAFGLLFNLLQATRAQEDDADAGADLDALATEYATAFHLMDPTVSLVDLIQPYPFGGTGVYTAVPLSEVKPVCSCGGGECECVTEDECGVLFWSNAASKRWRQWNEAEEGSAAEATAEDSWSKYRDLLHEAKKKCNKGVPGGGMVSVSGGTGVYSAAPSSEVKPGCSCSAVGNNCVCAEEFACGGARHVVHWDEKSGGILSAEWVCGNPDSVVDYLQPYPFGGTGVSTAVPSDSVVDYLQPYPFGGTGVSTAEPSSEDKPVCGCGGGNCACPKEDACKVQFYRGEARKWSREVMDEAPPPEGLFGVTPVELWNHYRKKSEEAEKQCK